LLCYIGFQPESLHAANNGLAIARDRLEPIKKKFPEISYGDLWTLAGVVAVQELVSDPNNFKEFSASRSNPN
jgi:catalase (peroxidase I)